jgi:hypothetical protein
MTAPQWARLWATMALVAAARLGLTLDRTPQHFARHRTVYAILHRR